VGSQRAAMTDIDPGAKLTIGHAYDVSQDRDKDHLVVYIPLAEHVDQEWICWYDRLARVKGIAASAEERPDEGVAVRVDVPAYIEPSSIRALLDTARALLKEADAVKKPPPMAEAEYAAREWWSQQSR